MIFLITGGGLPVGGVCLVGQDTKSTFTDVLKRCFIAEGVFHKHSIYIADLNESSDRLLNVSRYSHLNIYWVDA